jgi:hypothetical protein
MSGIAMRDGCDAARAPSMYVILRRQGNTVAASEPARRAAASLPTKDTPLPGLWRTAVSIRSRRQRKMNGRHIDISAGRRARHLELRAAATTSKARGTAL